MPASVRAQIDDGGMDGQAVLPDVVSDISGHALGHGRIGAVGGLKLMMDQHLLAVCEGYVEEAVGAADGGLLGIEHFDALDVVALEGEADEVVGVGLDELFGNRVEFGHGKELHCKNRAMAAAQR